MAGRRFTPGYTPSHKQQLGHEATERYVLLGGAAGPGKTTWLIEHAVDFAQRYPRVNVAVFRRTYPELRETFIERFLQRVPASWMSYNASERMARFPNGSVIWFRHCQHEDDVYKRQGPEYQLIAFDELTHFSSSIYDYLSTRLRCARPDVPLQMIAATNPGGAGHAWVKQRWIDRDPAAKVDLDAYCFVPATLDDHPSAAFREAYRAQLETNPDPVLRKALLHGDWHVFNGQFFAAWLDSLHVVEPFEIPPSWRRFRAIDYGGSAPFVCLWGAEDPAEAPSRLVVYRGYHRAGATLSENVAEVVRLSGGERYVDSVADPSMFAATQEQERGPRVSLAQQAEALGLKLHPANNDRLGGWSLCKEDLAARADGRPGVLFFSSCRDSIRTIPSLVYDRKRVEDLDTHGDDHDADAWRYLTARVRGKTPKARPRTGASRDAMLAGSPYGR